MRAVWRAYHLERIGSALLIPRDQGLDPLILWHRGTLPVGFGHEAASQQEEQSSCDKTRGRGDARALANQRFPPTGACAAGI